MTPSNALPSPTASWYQSLPLQKLGELVVPLAVLAIVIALITPLPSFILDLLIVADILVSVDDSGPGISPQIMERLFDPFVTSKISGMGLGLSLSRTFLRHQGGDMWNEPSRLGGARFVVRLTTQAKLQSNL